MKERKSILLVMSDCEDRHKILENLRSAPYKFITANNGHEAIALIGHMKLDLLLIAYDLPDMDGLALQNSIRKGFDIPIIILSAGLTESLMVELLDSGANDILNLPFGNAVHHARIRAALRYGNRQSKIINDTFSVEGLTVSYSNRIVKVDGEIVHLTPNEYRILTLLTQNSGKVLTHDQIINEVWGPYNSDNLVLRVNMANIRKKIEKNPAMPKYIITEVGVGYRALAEG